MIVTPSLIKPRLTLWPLAIVLLAMMLISFAVGQFPVSVRDLVNLTLGGTVPPMEETVIVQVRLPRVLGAVLV
nr:hypothetical protein [Gammaproteobacteria bacterium]MBA3731868.1 hypothetical protein [Gammaproteobacteria bacterium]